MPSTTIASKDLWAAARENDLERLQQLINSGADVNAVNAEGDTALIVAAQQGNAESCKWLVLAGAQLEKPDRELGATPLLCACISGKHHIIKCRSVSSARHLVSSCSFAALNTACSQCS
jgi:uncharacterized protein